MQELTFKQIFSVIFGTLTVIFICNSIGISNELAFFIFAPVNLFIMLIAYVYCLATRAYTRDILGKKSKSAIELSQSAFFEKALGVGIKKSFKTLSTKDILIAIFFFVCPILSLWMFATIIMAAYYDIMAFIEKNTIGKLNYGK